MNKREVACLVGVITRNNMYEVNGTMKRNMEYCCQYCNNDIKDGYTKHIIFNCIKIYKTTEILYNNKYGNNIYNMNLNEMIEHIRKYKIFNFI